MSGTPFSAELLWAVMNRLPDGISVLREREGSPAREIVLENSQAAAFREAGRDAPCIKTFEQELPSDLLIFSRGTVGLATTDSGDASAASGPRGKLILQVHSNPAKSVILKEAVEGVADLCFLGDPKTGELTYVNSSRLKWSSADWHRSDNGLESWARLLHPDDREATLAAWHEAATTGKPFDREYRLRRNESDRPEDVTWMRAKAGHVFNSFGRSIMIAGIVTDQTPAARYREALERKRSFMHTALDAVPLSVVIVEKDRSKHPVRFSNKESARILRVDPARAPKSLEELGSFFVVKDWAKLEEQDLPIARSLATGEVVSGQELVLYRADSTPGVARISSAPVRDPCTGAIIGAVAVAEDVSEKILSEKEKAARQAAEEAAEHMRRMVANVSHEVRTPIGGVMGLASALSDTLLDAEQKELVSGIKESAQLLLVVVNDLLDYSKIAAGKMEIEMKPFAPRRAIKHVLRLMGEVAKGKNLQLTAHIDPALPKAIVHSELRLKQILLNLVSNAVKFTPQGGRVALDASSEAQFPICDSGGKSSVPSPTAVLQPYTRAPGQPSISAASATFVTDAHKTQPSPASAAMSNPQRAGITSALARTKEESRRSKRVVEIRAYAAYASAGKQVEPGSWVRLQFAVKDTGIGLTQAQIAKLFQPYSQAECSTTRRYGGTGLGLALCRDLLQLMGGDIRVESEGEGKGCVFHFHFLAQVADTADVEASDSSPASRPAVSSVKGRRAGASKWLSDTSTGTRTPSSRLGTPTQHLQGHFTYDVGDSFVSAASAHSLSPHGVAHAGAGASGSGGNDRAATEESREPRVLVVDDNAINRMVAKRYLQKLGYTDVHLASDGAEAVDMVATDPLGFDIVFSDLMMPVMDGLEAASAIRKLADPRRSAVPIVAMSAGAEGREELMGKGLFCDWLPKPFDIKELREVLEHCLSTGTPA